MKKTATLLLMFLITCATATAQKINGSWTGKLSIGGVKLMNIVFNIGYDNDRPTCTLDSPDQGAKGIPAEIEITDNKKVKINMPMIMASYNGELVNGELKGVFTQSGMDFQLDMKPGTVKLNRPQTPQQPYPYKTEEVSFINASDSAILSGTLTYPTNYDTAAKGTVPVAVLVTGSGQQNRDEELFGHKPFLVLADYLARNGIATLRYDDRGTGKSTGDVANATTKDNMKDALAAIEYMRNTGNFGRVGVIGHSEGGTIAFMLGARDKADFIVSMAGPGESGANTIIRQNRLLMQSNGTPEKLTTDYCNALSYIINSITSGKDTANADSLVQMAVKEVGAELPKQATDNLAEIIKRNTPWMTYFLSYDPKSDIRSVSCPTMAINGSRDMQVESDANLTAIMRLLPHNSKNRVKEYEGLNHLFQHCTTGLPTEYGQIEETISPEVLEDIAEWIKKH